MLIPQTSHDIVGMRMSTIEAIALEGCDQFDGWESEAKVERCSVDTSGAQQHLLGGDTARDTDDDRLIADEARAVDCWLGQRTEVTSLTVLCLNRRKQRTARYTWPLTYALDLCAAPPKSAIVARIHHQVHQHRHLSLIY